MRTTAAERPIVMPDVSERDVQEQHERPNGVPAGEPISE